MPHDLKTHSYSWFMFLSGLSVLLPCDNLKFPQQILKNPQGKWTDSAIPSPIAFQFLNSSCSNTFPNHIMKTSGLPLHEQDLVRQTERGAAGQRGHAINQKHFMFHFPETTCTSARWCQSLTQYRVWHPQWSSLILSQIVNQTQAMSNFLSTQHSLS